MDVVRDGNPARRKPAGEINHPEPRKSNQHHREKDIPLHHTDIPLTDGVIKYSRRERR
jgi:hypothetical protein